MNYLKVLKIIKIKIGSFKCNPYAVKVGKLLKTLIITIKDVTCLAHMFHKVANKLKYFSQITDTTISLIK